MRALWLCVALGLGAGAASCDDDPCAGPTRCVPTGALPLATLREYDFFQGDMAAMTPKEGVVPYSVAAPLWADQAGKGRFIALARKLLCWEPKVPFEEGIVKTIDYFRDFLAIKS